MGVKVVDASALVALLFGEPEADAVAAALEGAQLVAPALLEFELANACLIKGRRHPEKRAVFVAAFRLRCRLSIETAEVAQDEVLELAQASDLTAYDASYLWLARRLDAVLVTLDRRLAAADEGRTGLR